MSVIQVDKFPVEVIQELLSYIDDATTLCRLASTCSTFSCIIKESEAVWQCLFQKRWTKRIPLTDFRVAYQRRHTTDRRALKILQTLSGSVMQHKQQQQHQSWLTLLGQRYGNEHWRLLQSQEFSSNIYDLLKALCSSSSDNYPTLVAQEIDDLTRCLAAHGVLAIHFTDLLRQWYSDVLISEKEDAIILEEGALLLVKSIQKLDEILGETEENVAVKELDAIANELHHRLDTENISLENAEQVIRILNTILIDEMGFQVDSDNNVHNLLIQHVLESRKGKQLILIALYKCICYRMGIPLQIIGCFIGEEMLGLPNDHGPPLFVDVFRVLSLEDCPNIAASYGFPGQSVFLRPLIPAQDVLRRMIDNIRRCRDERRMHQRLSMRDTGRVFFHRMLSMMTRRREDPDMQGFIATLEPELVLDARLFRRYNLISDERLNSIESQGSQRQLY